VAAPVGQRLQPARAAVAAQQVARRAAAARLVSPRVAVPVGLPAA
jgi:hypothetical protein